MTLKITCMKINKLLIILLISIIFSACEYDNFEEPKSTLSGSVVYDGKPVGIRTNGPQLELWQEGFALKIAIPVYIAHDGSYSVSLLNGQYKMVRKAGAPWEAQLNDTIIIDVKNNTVHDVPVRPYFTVSNESFQHSSGTLNANFTINKVVESANLAQVRIFVGHSILTDQNRNEQAIDVDLSEIVLNESISASLNLSDELADLDYIFVRVGVRASESNEFVYTQVEKITLN